ncbi:MAG: uL15 family ribosomal protein [Candidatus Kaiserbacteria bacterium]|nr:uL15 family ribosomal protein [Candidatus Kaiserbacteria bacterium]
MQLNSFAPRIKNKKNAPVGRGGRRGKTSGHGSKGQSSRAGHKIRPEMRDIIKKLPKLRGHGKNRARSVKTNRIAVTAVNLSELELNYNAGERVSPASLVTKGLIRRAKGRVPSVKILGSTITKALIVRGCTISGVAQKALLAAGGTYNA